MIRKEGVRGLWRGSSATIIRVAPGSSVYFMLLETFKWMIPFDSYFRKHHQTAFDMCCSFTARTTAGILLSPATVIKTRMESSLVTINSSHYSIHNFAKTIYRESGCRGFYRGLGASLARDVPFSSIYFPIYCYLQRQFTILFPQADSDPWLARIRTALSSLIGAAIASLVTQPADVIRTHAQLNRDAQGISIKDCVREVKAARGWRGFTVGLGPRLIKRCGSGMLTWLLFEEARRRPLL